MSTALGLALGGATGTAASSKARASQSESRGSLADFGTPKSRLTWSRLPSVRQPIFGMPKCREGCGRAANGTRYLRHAEDVDHLVVDALAAIASFGMPKTWPGCAICSGQCRRSSARRSRARPSGCSGRSLRHAEAWRVAVRMELCSFGMPKSHSVSGCLASAAGRNLRHAESRRRCRRSDRRRR